MAIFMPVWVAGVLLVFLGGAPASVILVAAVPLVALAIYFPCGRVWAAAREARRTTYFVTSARVGIVGGLFRRHAAEIPLASLQVLSLEERQDGSGDIYFTKPRRPYPFRYPPAFYGGRRPLGFYAIDDVQQVFRIIQDARKAAGGP